MKNPLKRQEGYSLVYIIILLGLVIIIGSAIFSLINTEITITKNNIYSTKAYYQGESKLQLVINEEKYYDILKDKIIEFLIEEDINNDEIYIDEIDNPFNDNNIVKIIINKEALPIIILKTTSYYNESKKEVEMSLNPFKCTLDEIYLLINNRENLFRSSPQIKKIKIST